MFFNTIKNVLKSPAAASASVTTLFSGGLLSVPLSRWAAIVCFSSGFAVNLTWLSMLNNSFEDQKTKEAQAKTESLIRQLTSDEDEEAVQHILERAAAKKDETSEKIHNFFESNHLDSLEDIIAFSQEKLNANWKWRMADGAAGIIGSLLIMAGYGLENTDLICDMLQKQLPTPQEAATYSKTGASLQAVGLFAASMLHLYAAKQLTENSGQLKLMNELLAEESTAYRRALAEDSSSLPQLQTI